jgi:hypothetical protein
MYKPMELPRPRNLGYAGDLPVRSTYPDLPKPQSPEQAQSHMQDAIPVASELPDIVRVRTGKGDPAIVGALLRQANGEESGLTGVPATYAAKVLQSWGYPTTMDAWDAATWESSIAANAAPNPLTMLGY